MSGRPLRRPPAVPDTEPEEKRGLMVSAAAHVAVVLVAIFGGPLFKGDEAQAVRIADVDLISSSEFDAMVSQAPEGPRGEVASLVPPKPGEDKPAPEAPKSDAPPQRSETASTDAAPAPTQPPKRQETVAPQETARPAARPEAPKAADAPVAPPKGVTASSPPLPAGPQNLDAPQRDAPVSPDAAPPRDLDRVAPTPAPPKQTIAEADKPTPATQPTEQATQTPPPPQQPAAAPQEATTQIVTEADETSEQDTLAPVASAPPRGRPEAPERPRAPEPETQTAAADPAPAETPKPDPKPAEAKPDPKPAEKPAQKPDPKPAEKPSQTASANSGSSGATTNAPQGPRLTSGQVNGVKLGVQKYWRMDRVTNLPNYEELVVVVQVRLDQSGKMVGKPKIVQPNGVPDARWRVAIQVAEIAATRAASAGFDLPRESYGRWQVIEFKFNPGRGVEM
ncbi:hypothetical protein P2H44_13450 [Albimonas sp. CAU 1670]|uniref:hypothetical protein n=1 Tax=Albimonas sp. CAU 1670 TaxID=3032599 RepID=UPI0023DB2BAE|nr:hypothetical protein [Albimonas sp. CAU 1670]MDF2233559.1 hypothetical protein [Albimonas sp. CAU 1670]